MRKIATILLIIMLLAMGSVFAGCQSTNKTEAYFNSEGLTYSQFSYDKENNKTHVKWAAEISNDTIYNITNFNVCFSLYLNDNLLTNETFLYDQVVKNGDVYLGTFSFEIEGEVDEIKFESWSCDFDTFWNTYKWWIIGTSIAFGIFAIIYLILMIVFDLELDDTWDNIVYFFEDYGYIAYTILILVIPAVGVPMFFNWVIGLILLSGIIVFIVLSLIGHLIKYIIDYGMCFGSCGNYSGYSEDNDFDDGESLENYTKEELKDYCRVNGITGFSSLNKSELIELINKYEEKIEKFNEYTISELKEYCRDNDIKGYSSLNKDEIIGLIINKTEVTKDVNNIKKTNKNNDSKKGVIKFDDIAGLDEAKDAFREKVILPIEHRDLYEKFGKKVGGGILLYGLPGTGKTMFAKACSNELDALFIPIKCSDIKSKWYGESEQKVKEIFSKARKSSKSIIFFDEFEAIGSKRTNNDENGNNDLVPQILAEMQGVNSSGNNACIMVIAATNKPWSIDSAFLRPGRFDEKIYIPLPDGVAREKLFEIKLKDIPKDELNYKYLSDITEGFNGADITEFCEKLKMEAIKDNLKENSTNSIITMEHVNRIEGKVKSSVNKDDIIQLQEFEGKC